MANHSTNQLDGSGKAELRESNPFRTLKEAQGLT